MIKVKDKGTSGIEKSYIVRNVPSRIATSYGSEFTNIYTLASDNDVPDGTKLEDNCGRKYIVINGKVKRITRND